MRSFSPSVQGLIPVAFRISYRQVADNPNVLRTDTEVTQDCVILCRLSYVDASHINAPSDARRLLHRAVLPLGGGVQE